MTTQEHETPAGLWSAERRKLPGSPRPQADAYREWQRGREALVSNGVFPPEVARAVADIHFGAAEDLHRWRIQLECGHICEVLGRGGDQPPLRWHARHGLFGDVDPGYYICPEEGCEREWPAGTVFEHSRSRPSRPVMAWGGHKHDVVLEPHPEEPPAWWAGSTGDWIRFRRTGRKVIPHYTVTLSCGHLATAPAGKLMAACAMCSWQRAITAYEYVGPLLPPPPPPPKPRKPPDPAGVLRRRIRTAEREAQRLRRELAGIEAAS